MAVTLNQEKTNPSVQTAPTPRGFSVLWTIVRYALLLALGLLFFMPFIISFFSTFKTTNEILSWPPTILPKEWLWDNWAAAWNTRIPGVSSNIFPRWLFNSLWVAVVTVIAQLFFCSLAAYAFARMEFPGKNVLFSIMLASMAIPGVITLIPGYVFFAKLNNLPFGIRLGINTYWPILLPNLAVPFGIFLLTQFFKSIPKELEEAATIDGAGRFRTYWSIVLPMARPALITLGILSFQGSWNNFTGPLLFLRKPDLMTLTVGLNFFKGQYVNDWPKIMIGTMFNAIPILIIFFIFSRYYVEGQAAAGVKG
ncbi:MAG: carbohydrate ABC transporter permease [Herpetosiphonaceae bacterium]|nr:carbohydrate ABC transporter permease [Herpetosiphonaceae bacterium]